MLKEERLKSKKKIFAEVKSNPLTIDNRPNHSP